MRLFNVIASYKSFRVLATVVDTKSYYEKHPDRDAEDMYHDAFEAVCARFQYYLQDMQRATTGSPFYGMVVIDERNNQQNKQLDNFTSIYSTTTTADALTTTTWWRACSSQLHITASACNSRIWSLEPSTARYPKAIRVSTM